MCNRSGVLSLCVFRPEVIKAAGFTGGEAGAARVTGGQHDGAGSLATWLKFWSPLSHSCDTFTLSN